MELDYTDIVFAYRYDMNTFQFEKTYRSMSFLIVINYIIIFNKILN